MFCKQADFSSVKDAGTYKIKTDDGEESAEFKIGDDIYGDLYKDVVLMLYNSVVEQNLTAALQANLHILPAIQEKRLYTGLIRRSM